MKLLHLSTLYTASMLILSGCATLTPTPEKKAQIDSSLPVVSLTKNGIITDMNSVAFEWKSIRDPRVEGIYVYKRTPQDENQKIVKFYDTIENRFSTHYVDNDVQPDTKYTYAFKVFTKDAEGKQSRSFDLNTLPVLQSVSWIHSIGGMPRSAKIIWRPHINQRVESYIIERKSLEDKEWETLDRLKGRLNAEYIDKDLKDNHVYMYRVRVKTFDDIISTPSEIVKVVTKPLPKPVVGLKASKNLPKQIKLSWRDSTQKDFYRYHLYRAEDIDGNYELIAKLYNNNYVDKIDEDGKAYFYRVSVVDKDGLESEHDVNTIMGMTLPKPAAPVVVEAKLIGNSIEIVWSKVDPRSKSYIVVRKHKKGWFDETTKEFKNIRGNKFIDKNIEPDSTYSYVVYSVDKYNLVSKASIEVILKTPESNTLQEAPKMEEKHQEVQQAALVKQTSTKDEVLAPMDDLNINEN